MSNFILLAVCFIAGLIINRHKQLPLNAHKVISMIVVNVTLPSMALLYLHKLEWTTAVCAAIAMPWGIFTLAALTFFFIGGKLGWSKETVGAVTLVTGLGNTSFVGAPIVEAIYGSSALPIVMAIDQAGSYLVLCTLGVLIAVHCSGGTPSWKQITLKIITYPPFVAMAIAIALIPVAYPEAVSAVLQRLADMTAPLVLLSIGMQMSFKEINVNRNPLVVGLSFKLLACPVVVFLAYLFLGVEMGANEHVTLLESAMGPSAGAAVVAMQHNLNPKLVTLIVGIGIPLSILTAPAVNFLATKLV